MDSAQVIKIKTIRFCEDGASTGPQAALIRLQQMHSLRFKTIFPFLITHMSSRLTTTTDSSA